MDGSDLRILPIDFDFRHVMLPPRRKVKRVQVAALFHVVGLADALHDIALGVIHVIRVTANDRRQ